MKGRITLLIDHAQTGTIAGEDGVDYTFVGDSLVGMTFGSLGIGAQVTFVANAITKRAGSVRFAPTGVGRPRS
jgi:hypothetical protein